MAKKKYAELKIYRESRGKDRAEQVSSGTWMRRGAVHDETPARFRRQEERAKEKENDY